MTKVRLATFALSAILYGQAMASECFCNLCSTPRMSDPEAAVACVRTHAKPESKETGRFRQLVECSVRQWQCRDGALSYDLSDSMLALMESNPQVFFDVMAERLELLSTLKKIKPRQVD
jgi:Tfp pilus assembly protein FimV